MEEAFLRQEPRLFGAFAASFPYLFPHKYVWC
jgi:hypothetical protein